MHLRLCWLMFEYHIHSRCSRYLYSLPWFIQICNHITSLVVLFCVYSIPEIFWLYFFYAVLNLLLGVYFLSKFILIQLSLFLGCQLWMLSRFTLESFLRDVCFGFRQVLFWYNSVLFWTSTGFLIFNCVLIDNVL